MSPTVDMDDVNKRYCSLYRHSNSEPCRLDLCESLYRLSQLGPVKSKERNKRIRGNETSRRVLQLLPRARVLSLQKQVVRP
jgi:hypothetical protein